MEDFELLSDCRTENDSNATDSDYYPENNFDEDDDTDYEDKEYITEDNMDIDCELYIPPALNLRRIYEGTGTTIADLVNACMYNSAAVALRYNRRSLKVIDGQLYAVPLCEKSLGVTLRTRPTPSANRTLDVNLCYLRHTFQQYDVLLPSITACRRVSLCSLPMEIMEDMLFQIILLRFTGRVYRFEQYRKFKTAKYCSDQGDRIQCYAGIPGWSNNKFFLNFVRMDLEINKAKSMSRWVSRQHDGAISFDLRNNFSKFYRFIEYIALNISAAMRELFPTGLISIPEQQNRRGFSQSIIEKLIKEAMDNGSIGKLGRIQWMANAIISDMEEFVVEPFGALDASTIPLGNYSQQGHEMLNRAEDETISFHEAVQKIALFVCNKTPDKHLNILGFRKIDGRVVNIVNNRPFCAVDSEHFLCKAWLIAKFTFGHNRICKYPRQCNNYTHPSPVIHQLEMKAIDDSMKIIEDAYMTIISGNTDTTSMPTLPDFCILPGEEINSN
jgi:hypothetical protein